MYREAIMTEIKAGQIAYVKTTEDPLMVLQIRPVAGYNTAGAQLSGVEVLGRRPLISEKGNVTYELATFFIEELETKEDQVLRKASELEELKAKFQSSKGSVSRTDIPMSN
jgi:hypothetical protein